MGGPGTAGGRAETRPRHAYPPARFAEPMAAAPSPPAGELPTAVHAGDLFCDVCQEVTPHRILRTGAVAQGGAPRTVSGTARCRRCKWVHPFVLAPRRSVVRRLVISEGSRSESEELELDPTTLLRVGANVPGKRPEVRILRLDTTDDRSASEATAERIRTIWTRPVAGRSLPVSIVEGRRTRAARVPEEPGRSYEIGGELLVEGLPCVISAMRADGTTWHDPGRSFPGEAVERLYVRRMARPPAGRSDWRSDRETESSRASSTSSAGRSRSSPGIRIIRSRPRERRASGGAADQRVAP